MTLSTQPFSSLRTSSRNLSTSRQQSSGRRSFSRRHRTTSPRASSTEAGTSRTSLRLSTVRRSRSTSLFTACRETAFSLSSSVVSDATLDRRDPSRASDSAESLRSSAATRFWIWDSRRALRVASFFAGGRELSAGSGLGYRRLSSSLRGGLTSGLDCSDSTMSWDTLAGEDLREPRPSVNFAHSAERISPDCLAYPFQTCVGPEPDSFDELAPILSARQWPQAGRQVSKESLCRRRRKYAQARLISRAACRREYRVSRSSFSRPGRRVTGGAWQA